VVADCADFLVFLPEVLQSVMLYLGKTVPAEYAFRFVTGQRYYLSP